MTQVQSFDPVIGSAPKILILGSMPGVASLEAQQYYAHPRNAFWSIMGELFGVEWSQDYTQRIIQFRQLPLVLWDVLQSCHRSGSLDGNIENQNLVPNDIGRVLNLYPAINTLVFNGAAAHQLFRRHVISQLDSADGLRLLRLPSTSPAHAAVNRQQKLQHWAVIRTILQSSEPACGADIS